ncbi:MAG: TniB family NTP-binding protein [Terriglobales bacterium]
MDRTVTQFDSVLVPHSKFAEAVRRMEQNFTYAQQASEPICMALIGESRTGKSRALETFLLNHPKKRLRDGMNVPVLSVKAPSRPTVKSLAELMIEELGASDPGRGTENDRTRRLKVLMKGTQTRMLMIDEFQHFYDKGTKAIIHHVTDWLKILVDDLRCALVVAGLPSSKAVIDQNEQLAGRFQAPLHLSRFQWTVLDDREDFKGILREFDAELRERFQIPEFHNERMAYRFWVATGGLIGYLTKLLRKAVWNAVDRNRKEITLEDLHVAHRESMWDEPGVEIALSPFDRNFKLETSTDVVQQVLRIGTVVNPIESTPRITHRHRPKRASACLTRN